MKNDNDKIKPTKTISSEIVNAMKEGYPLRKAISIAELKKSKPKKE